MNAKLIEKTSRLLTQMHKFQKKSVLTSQNSTKSEKQDSVCFVKKYTHVVKKLDYRSQGYNEL
ncbi:MAG: hypothetical protein CVU11_00215 [Bacteroidetes bacterium HGW-Bacteroidetes-6]|jgi:hypothetical protein|nr:MAG: hypothetical protein CVU11_00215 [Bacteroidetes bacterium HGW-Bacteroidetes-6]